MVTVPVQVPAVIPVTTALTVTCAGVNARAAPLEDACSQPAGQFAEVTEDAEMLNSTGWPTL